jgi:two-component system sensor histidine kinase RpfC
MFPGAGVMRAAPRVLYVDDNTVNLKVVAALMEALDVAVCCCGSADEALQILAREAFTIIFTDIHMPGASGFDLLAELRGREGPNRAAPVVALTADASRSAAQYHALGFDAFAPKPVTLRLVCELLLQFLAPASDAVATEAAQLRRQSI